MKIRSMLLGALLLSLLVSGTGARAGVVVSREYVAGPAGELRLDCGIGGTEITLGGACFKIVAGRYGGVNLGVEDLVNGNNISFSVFLGGAGGVQSVCGEGFFAVPPASTMIRVFIDGPAKAAATCGAPGLNFGVAGEIFAELYDA